MRDALLTAAGAMLVALLNELRAQLRARQADRDRREALIAAALRRSTFLESIEEEPTDPRSWED